MDKKKLIFATLLLLVGATGGAAQPLRLATTTSTYETGLLDHILPPFEEQHGVRVHVISTGTGKALILGENGDVDVVLVHAPEAEERFVAAGYGVNRRPVMYNDFILLGPGDDPAGISGLREGAAALALIMDTQSGFVSRGDESGTHVKEKSLWASAGREPHGAWYLEAGQGMSATLRIADEKGAYVLVDRGTYLANRSWLGLQLLVEGDVELFNPYGIIAVSPYRHPHVQYQQSMALIAWITSPACQQLIAAFKREQEQLFFPSADGLDAGGR